MPGRCGRCFLSSPFIPFVWGFQLRASSASLHPASRGSAGLGPCGAASPARGWHLLEVPLVALQRRLPDLSGKTKPAKCPDSAELGNSDAAVESQSAAEAESDLLAAVAAAVLTAAAAEDSDSRKAAAESDSHVAVGVAAAAESDSHAAVAPAAGFAEYGSYAAVAAVAAKESDSRAAAAAAQSGFHVAVAVATVGAESDSHAVAVAAEESGSHALASHAAQAESEDSRAAVPAEASEFEAALLLSPERFLGTVRHCFPSHASPRLALPQFHVESQRQHNEIRVPINQEATLKTVSWRNPRYRCHVHLKPGQSPRYLWLEVLAVCLAHNMDAEPRLLALIPTTAHFLGARVHFRGCFLAVSRPPDMRVAYYSQVSCCSVLLAAFLLR